MACLLSVMYYSVCREGDFVKAVFDENGVVVEKCFPLDRNKQEEDQ